MLQQSHKNLSLNFAYSLSNRDYDTAYSMCSPNLKSKISVKEIQEQFEIMIPLDWGDIDPIELEENDSFPFIYVDSFVFERL